MLSIQQSVHHLAARLPELEWKLSTLNFCLHAKKLPKTLFSQQQEMTAQSCIEEIKADLRVLGGLTNERSAHYLAERTSQKINVLVRLCLLYNNKTRPIKEAPISLQTFSTRQQWLQQLQDEFTMLSSQQEALQKTLVRLQAGADLPAILNVQAELGAIEQKLTLAKETLAREEKVIIN